MNISLTSNPSETLDKLSAFLGPVRDDFQTRT